MAKKKKPKRPPPPIVQFAIVVGDREACRRFGRAGAMRKKEIAAKDREKKEKKRLRRVKEMLFYAAEMARQANEHIAPLPD